MLFNSLAFAVFLPVVLAVYYSLERRAQNVWLLLASYFFYGCWDWRFLGLLGFSTTVDFVCGKAIADSRTQRGRRLFLLASIASNLGVLCFFKYFNFFVDSAADLLNLLGLHATHASLSIILPVGISFYTFQSLSYTTDVYRGHTRPCRDWLTFSLFVAYFPQLLAGPIERSTELLPQLQRDRKVCGQDLQEGTLLILIGLFKKIGIADVLAPSVEQFFSQPRLYSGLGLLVGIYFFSLQIYCDFSGYSDIARGTSRLLGIDLRLNFNRPYFSRSLTEFWRRWHMSLSGWLRDYLYIPLGGSRGGPWRTYRNLLITMLLGGLWHGAAWTFVAWGGLHGLGLAVERALGVSAAGGRTGGAASGPDRGSWIWDATRMLLTFHIVALGWIFFRAGTFSQAWQYLHGLAVWQSGELYLGATDFLRVGCLVAVLLVVELIQTRTADQIGLTKLGWIGQAASGAALVVLIVALGGWRGDVPFIYFQF